MIFYMMASKFLSRAASTISSANIVSWCNRPLESLEPLNPWHWVKEESIYSKKPDLYGEVVRACLPKTVKVEVLESAIHERAQKVHVKKRFFLVHDPNETARVGDWVEITPGYKRGRYKNYLLKDIIIPARRFIDKNGDSFTQSSPDVKLLTAQCRKDFIKSLYDIEEPPKFTNAKLDAEVAKMKGQFQK